MQNMQSLGDWIRFKRSERNLAPGHLAAKMGIAASLVCAWEEGESQPDENHIGILARIFGERPKEDLCV